MNLFSYVDGVNKMFFNKYLSIFHYTFNTLIISCLYGER